MGIDRIITWCDFGMNAPLDSLRPRARSPVHFLKLVIGDEFEDVSYNNFRASHVSDKLCDLADEFSHEYGLRTSARVSSLFISNKDS